jgi:hypothetical protein
MTYLYGWKWHDQDRHPIDEMTEEQARKAWVDGPQLGVAAGDDLEPGRVPAYSLEMSAMAEDVRVNLYDAAGSTEVILDYGTIDGRLFLEEVTEYLYPDDGEYHSQGGHVAVRMFSFTPDGTCELRSRLKETGVETVEEFDGVDVSDHWLDPLDWGEWDRIGTHRPAHSDPAAED